MDCRVSLTYRVKSAHKVKLTDKQLLQWMFPILLVMLIYLGTWTLSAPPNGEDIFDNSGLRFKQCTYNWWDHSLAIGQCRFFLLSFQLCTPLARVAIQKARAVNLFPESQRESIEWNGENALE
jgi:hypothetical protein